MLKTRRFNDELTPIEGVREDTSQRLCLLIIGDGFVATYPLPDSGDLIIGRSDEADIAISSALTVNCVEPPVGGVGFDPNPGELALETPDSSSRGILAGVVAAAAAIAVALGGAAWFALRRVDR